MKSLCQAILIGLGAARLMQIVKEAVPWPMATLVKSVGSLTIVSVLSALFSGDPRRPRAWIPIALGAAGVSSLTHEVQDFLSVSGDKHKQDVMIRALGTRTTVV